MPMQVACRGTAAQVLSKVDAAGLAMPCRMHQGCLGGSCALLREKRPGTFACAGCGNPLFEGGTKFESGTGWPSFDTPLDGAVETTQDRSLGMLRTEVHCSQCGGHLGHVFPDGPPPTHQRYCMNGVALTFSPAES